MGTWFCPSVVDQMEELSVRCKKGGGVYENKMIGEVWHTPRERKVILPEDQDMIKNYKVKKF